MILIDSSNHVRPSITTPVQSAYVPTTKILFDEEEIYGEVGEGFIYLLTFQPWTLDGLMGKDAISFIGHPPRKEKNALHDINSFYSPTPPQQLHSPTDAAHLHDLN